MVRLGTGFDADQARRLLPEERQDVTPLQLPADDDLTFRINAVDLENRLGDVETDCRDRLHAWLLQIVGALTAHTFMALTCRWRSRPQHHKQTLAKCTDNKLNGQGAFRLRVLTTQAGPHLKRAAPDHVAGDIEDDR